MAKNENETKRDKFVRLAEARTNKALDQIKLISNLSDRSTYEYTDDDINKIFTCLEKELKIARSRFNSTEDIAKFKLL